MSELLLPLVPETVTVHLGAPAEKAANVTVPFTQYIKNSASSEIYPTWPYESLKANIYAIISFAMNRIYTEHYRTMGYDFDITNNTAFDQAFINDREIYENIGVIVDEIFNNYLVKGNAVEPFIASFCNGVSSKCEGLSQWGTVELANEGLDHISILRRYYGENIRIVENAPVGNIGESYPGFPLVLGDSGNTVKIIQTQLNRISLNYPAIPQIKDVNGIFGIDTRDAVKTFQKTFSLPQTGEVDKSTWYKIKRYYVSVKSLSELFSEGLTVDEITLPFNTPRPGSSGNEVLLIQFYLETLNFFNGNLPSVTRTGVYDKQTSDAIIAFNRYYGLTPTGQINAATWNKMNEVYKQSVQALPTGYSHPYATYYPGFYLSEGIRDPSVADLQAYLTALSEKYDVLPPLPITGYFGSQTKEAVEKFQELFAFSVTGAVGPLVWNKIAEEYDALLAK